MTDRAIVMIFGLCVIALGSFSLLGYLSGHPEYYSWSSSKPGMGMNTAIAFTLVGISLFLLGRDVRGKS